MSPTVKKIVSIGAVVVIAIGVFVAGFYAHDYYAAQQQKAAINTAATFVKDIVADKKADAYKLTSKTLQAKQKQADFSTALGDLKSTKPTFNEALHTQQGKTFYYSQRVLGLPASGTGSTNATFLVGLQREGSGWKVVSVSVQ